MATLGSVELQRTDDVRSTPDVPSSKLPSAFIARELWARSVTPGGESVMPRSLAPGAWAPAGRPPRRTAPTPRHHTTPTLRRNQVQGGPFIGASGRSI